MARFSTVLKTALVLAGVLLTGFLLGRYWSAAPVPAQSTLSTVTSATALEMPTSRQFNDGYGQQPRFDSDLAALRNRPRGIELTPQGEPVLTNWEDNVEAILLTETNANAKADEMLQLFPRLPEEGQREVAQYLSGMLADTNYAALGQYLTNATTSEPVLDILLAGLLNRPSMVKLPWLLEMAEDAQNPRSEQAYDLLQVFLEQDYGNDWSRWQASISSWLKDNPDKMASRQ